MEDKHRKFGRTFLIFKLVVFVSILLVIAITIYSTKQNKEDAPESEDAQKEESAKGVELKSNPNIDTSVEAFLANWVDEHGVDLKKLITENFYSVTGHYVYAAELEDTEDVLTFNTGITTLMLHKNVLTVYDGFMDKVAEPNVGDTGLLIVNYNNDNIIDVEFYKLNSNLEEMRDSLLNTKIPVASNKNNSTSNKAEKVYSDLSAQDWQGMTLLASRDIITKDMAPIFIVPVTDINSATDLTDTFYYILAGELNSTSDMQTTLKTYEGKTISLDFKVNAPESSHGRPVWIHVITKDGEIQSADVQAFEGADLNTMAEGMIGYITMSTVTDAK